MILRGFPVGPIEANCYIFGDEGRSEVFVIDAGDEAERILETLRLLKVRPIALVNTHGHFDHIQAVDAVRRATGAPFWIHEGEAELLRQGPARAKLLFDLDLPPSPVPDRWLTEGDTLQVGPLFLTVRHTPGHSPGGICLLGDGLAFVGDTLFAGSIGRTDLSGGDYTALMRSITGVLFALGDSATVHPGHGPDTTILRERTKNPFVLEYLATLRP